MPALTRIKIKITGRVQGVFYRQSTQDKARALGLSGWVRNTGDGAVEVEACGAPGKVEELISWCRKGPPQSRVKDVLIEWRQEKETEPDEPQDFEITY